jgi:ABC-2 type transport system permease protein
LFSSLAKENTGVLLGTGGVVLICSLFSFIPKVQKFLPTQLTDGNSLIYGVTEIDKYVPALVIAGVMTLVCFAVSIPIFNKKQL